MVPAEILGNLLDINRFMKDKICLLLLAAVVMLGSCKSFSYLTVDLTVPPKDGFPDHIQGLTLVNRAVDSRFTDDPEDSVQLRFYRSGFVVDTVINDTHAADTLVQALANLLFESGRFDVVIPENRFLMKDSVNLFSDTMSWTEVKKLTQLFNTDAVLSLDYFRTGISTNFNRQYFTVNDINDDMYFPIYHASMKIDYTVIFRLYDPHSQVIIPSYFITDTLTWVGNHDVLADLFKGFTPVKKGISEAGIAAALNMAGKIAPHWTTTERAYFVKGSELLKRTKTLVIDNDWKKSRQLWLELLEKTRSKPLRSKLEFNIALSYEMEGDLNEAIRWSVRSYNTLYRSLTYNYLEKLKERKLLLTQSSDEKNP